MASAGHFVSEAARRGVALWTGVPCSFLKPFINHVITNPTVRYVAAANEGDAVAVAAGAHLGGTTGVVMFQNSGLGNAVNPLTSLAATHRIPMLLIVTLRADPEGRPDEPQHALMGSITAPMLEVLGIPWEHFPEDESQTVAALDRAFDHIESQRTPFAFVMREGAVDPVPAPPNGSLGIRPRPKARDAIGPGVTTANGESGAWAPSRADTLRVLQETADARTVIIATTGFTGRELFALEDRANQFYLVGAMGCASSVGLGLALTRPDVRVVIADGDGAALMRLGAWATIGAYRPDNLIHVLLDNGVHESTGGQETVSAAIDFVNLATSCGYATAIRCDTPEGLRDAVTHDGLPGPRLLHVRTAPGVMPDLPRPNRGPVEVTRRMREHLAALVQNGRDGVEP